MILYNFVQISKINIGLFDTQMSAKAAEEQMKEIQSESQRLLRESYIK